MKKILILVTLVSLLASCHKDETIVPEGLPAEVTFGVEFSSVQTKASNSTSYSWENKVNSVQYFVFNKSGLLEASFSNTGTGTVSKTLATGQKTIWAVVNVPEERFSGCTDLSDFLSREVSFDDVSSYSFPMSGSTTATITSGSNTINISVSQLLCRLIFQDIVNQLEDNLEEENFEVGNIFLSNVVCNSRIDGGMPSTIEWSAKCGRKDGALSADDYIENGNDFKYGWTHDNLGDYVYWDDDYGIGDFFYFFPNNSTSVDVNGWTSPFTPRYTRLVVEVYIRGERYFYPINLNGAKRNHSYDLYLTITRPGSLDPDTFDWAEIEDITINIGGFDDWDEDFVITY